MRALITAIRTLSIIPLPGRDTERPATALPWFPAVGFLMGCVVAGVVFLVNRLTAGTWPAGTAVLALLTGTILTRAIHLDGLADWADGLGVSGRENILRVMKDHHTGAFGAIALIIVLIAKWACLATLAAAGAPAWIITAWVVSRATQADLASSQPYARENGTGAPFIGLQNRRYILPVFVFALLLCWASGRIQGIAALAGGLLTARAFGASCRARVGGATGDMLGACSEIVETAVLAAGALAVSLERSAII